MKIFKKISGVVIGIVFIFVILNLLPYKNYEVDDVNVWLKANNNNVPLVIAHGGGQLVTPGDTMSAFQYSFDLGVDVLEMDVHLTSDGILVTRHGENETGNIRHMSNCDTVIWNETYEWLYENCNFGYNYEIVDGVYPYRDMTHSEWVEAGVYMTTLDEIFTAFGDEILYIIEIKADANAPRTETADALIALINDFELRNQVIVACSFEDISAYITKSYPDTIQSASQGDAQEMIIKTYTFVSLFFNPENNSSMQIPISSSVPVINELNLATRLLVKNAHRHNMAVHYWTINDPKVMRELIAIGADGIVTDDPALLMSIINSE